jgi:inner membrane protein
MNNSNKQLFKAMIIVILIALLMVPTYFIGNLVMERKLRKQEISKEISNAWAMPQIISSPYLQLSYAKNTVAVDGPKYKGYIMASNSVTEATINPIIQYRGIYKIQVYNAQTTMVGKIAKKDMESFVNKYGTINYPNSFLVVNISDAKGLLDSATITINNTTQLLEVGNVNVNNPSIKTLSISLNAIATDVNNDIQFKIQFKLKGTEKLSFVPLASNNTINMHSTWENPSFEGTYATSNKSINKKGFDAKWDISKHNTSIATITDVWPSTQEHIFGVNLINPIDSYAKILRTTKYAILFIALTFAFFFFVEVLQDKQIHPIQYTLVGLALVVFYTLLLSISEYIFFDWAYIIACIATTVLIALYTKSIMKSVKTALIMGLVLVALYSFMYTIIQLEETSLLVGSIGLFVVLAIIMQLSKKINWSKIAITNIVKPQ